MLDLKRLSSESNRRCGRAEKPNPYPLPQGEGEPDRRARLSEHLFELIDEALGERVVDGFAVELGEFLEQLALARGQTARRLDDYLDELIAASVAVKIDDAFAFEAQDFSRLRGGRNFEFHFAVERRHFYHGADRRLRRADRRLDYHVVVLAHEHLVLLVVDNDVEISLRSAAVAGLALTAQL